MNVEITTRIGCKNNCIYCPQPTIARAYQDKTTGVNAQVMSLTTFKKIIRKLPRHIVISFCGMSEPFLNPQCTEMILFAHFMKRKVSIFTTLVGLTSDNLQRILHTLTFNDTDQVFKVHLPSEGRFEHIIVNSIYIQTLRSLLQSGIPIDFRYHGDSLNPLVKKMIDESTYSAHKIVPTTRAHNVAVRGVTGPKRMVDRIYCRMHDVRDSHVILPDGSVLLCCMDYSMKHILGNLFTESYSAIQRGTQMKTVTSGLSDESVDILCRRCEYAVPASGWSEYRNISMSPRKLALGVRLVSYTYGKSLYLRARNVKNRVLGQKIDRRQTDPYLQK